MTLPIVYEGEVIDAGYRLDIVVEDSIILEINAIEALSRVNEAQSLTYLKFSGYRLRYLMNFNVVLFMQGLRRFVG